MRNHIKTHTQVQQPIYDQQRYLIQLAARQNKFKQQISQIQNDFAGINRMLNDTNLKNGQKKIKLNQALADQRDLLIDAQTQLNIPYQFKSCQCIQLTEQRKIQLTDQLNKVNIKISQLQKTSNQTTIKCPVSTCPLMSQINTQIIMLKSYQKIMQQTISSKCCKIIKYQYRDNLDTPNWHFGNTTQNQYQAKIYQRQQQGNIKLQPCSYMFPFVKLESNQCFSCPTDKPLFNLGMRVCEKDCTVFSNHSDYTLNKITHVCGLNKDCPDGQYYDLTMKQCTTPSQNFNESQCPPQRPFWQPVSLSCQACSSQTPYFDLSIRKCRKCLDTQRWNSNLRVCQSSSTPITCNNGYFYNTVTKKCQPLSNNTNTNSLCPPDRPYWNQFTFSCDSCTLDKPFYDFSIKQCRVCNADQTFNQITKQCVKKTVTVTCLPDQFYNDITKSCQKKGTTSMCPPATPYWDSVNFKCTKCPTDKPIYNQATKACEPCPLNLSWSQTFLACIQSCIQGQQWNTEFKRCVKINRTCAQKQVFSFEMNKCIIVNCNVTNPYWNSTANQCQPCPLNTVYNSVTNNCQKDSRSGNISVCYQDKPVWNSQYLRCQPCPTGTQWNSLYKQCLKPSINTTHYKYEHNSRRHHKLQTSDVQQNGHKQQQKFIQGQVYGDNQIAYQHRWLHNARR